MISGSFRQISKQCFQRLGSPVPSTKHLRFQNYGSDVIVHSKPVKLAFVSYESMKDTTQNSQMFPIIIMHGLLGSKNNWNSLSKRIHKETGRKVICVDARNHGDSPHSSDMTYQHMSQDIVDLIKDLKAKKVILIGHSMGGSTMMYTALNYPELVEKLVIIDMNPVRISPSLTEMLKIFQAMKTVTLDGNPSLSKARKMADEQLSASVHSERIRQFVLMNLVEAETGIYKWRVNLPVLEQNFAKNIAVFPNSEKKVYLGPTLFIGGEESDYLKKEDHERINKLFPTAKFQYVPEAGHWVHVDKPAEFLSTVTEFIRSP
ncbi:protein ABHD11 [Belonocnema kinseyi]|uniref:protein ABHD11 n=1 Tax=Belonocnema kinseyi TaxID=2817044 RepID=UPI00143D7EE7|nr:protein ABHD11 [Belonocnema kinseyi]